MIIASFYLGESFYKSMVCLANFSYQIAYLLEFYIRVTALKVKVSSNRTKDHYKVTLCKKLYRFIGNVAGGWIPLLMKEAE